MHSLVLLSDTDCLPSQEKPDVSILMHRKKKTTPTKHDWDQIFDIKHETTSLHLLANTVWLLGKQVLEHVLTPVES